MEMEIKILLVDDEEEILIALEAALSMAGYNIDTANTAFEALEKLKTTEYHILMTDINMPGMDGLELLSEVKNQYPTIEVIMLTAYSTLSKIAASYENGANDYIMKPFENPNEIEEVVTRTAVKVKRWKNLVKKYLKTKTH